MTIVQAPVLPLPTPLAEFTHGVYCDDTPSFGQSIMRARKLSHSFLPSNGVWMSYSRLMLEKLAEMRSNRVFEPVSLPKGYEGGVLIHQPAFTQTFPRVLAGARMGTRSRGSQRKSFSHGSSIRLSGSARGA